MEIVATERLVLRELNSATDAEFVLELLNTPKFIRYIGDRGVRTVDEAAAFIDDRYAASYREHGYGLYVVDERSAARPVGICGFVKREVFEFPDVGFAFLPEHEGRGYGYESALAVLGYGRNTLGFTRVLAITSQDNDVSVRLLTKLGFEYQGLHAMSESDVVNLFQKDL